MGFRAELPGWVDRRGIISSGEAKMRKTTKRHQRGQTFMEMFVLISVVAVGAICAAAALFS